MTAHEHAYSALVEWNGNTGTGTATYAGYARSYRVHVSGKRDLELSADPAFRGDPTRHNPEDLFLTAVSACHMLFYLALCARERIPVVAYTDQAEAILRMDASGGGRFEAISLHPRVTIADASQRELAAALHRVAHEQCFIANSCSSPITCDAVIQAAECRTEAGWTT